MDEKYISSVWVWLSDYNVYTYLLKYKHTKTNTSWIVFWIKDWFFEFLVYVLHQLHDDRNVLIDLLLQELVQR